MKSFILIFALLITLSAVYYQWLTDSTTPVTTTLNTGIQKFPLEFKRTHVGSNDCPVIFRISDITVTGVLFYRKFPEQDEMKKVEMKREGDNLVAYLPKQPRGNEIEYYFSFEKSGTIVMDGANAPIVVRFRGDVPDIAMIPYILLMLLSMVLSNVTGIYALFRINTYKYWAAATFVALAVGGLVLGPVVQKYAFNELWSEVPLGLNVSNNKTLIVIFAWLVALVMIQHKRAFFWVFLASLITFALFLFPHGLFVDQLSNETGKMIQERVLPFMQLI